MSGLCPLVESFMLESPSIMCTIVVTQQSLDDLWTIVNRCFDNVWGITAQWGNFPLILLRQKVATWVFSGSFFQSALDTTVLGEYIVTSHWPNWLGFKIVSHETVPITNMVPQMSDSTLLLLPGALVGKQARNVSWTNTEVHLFQQQSVAWCHFVKLLLRC